MKHKITEINSEVTFQNGTTHLKINEEELFFAAYRSFRPEKEILNEFSREDFRLFCIHTSGIASSLAGGAFPYSVFGEVWSGEEEYEWDNLRSQVEMFEQSTPNAYYLAMIDLNTPDWMLEQYPEMRSTWKELIQDVSNPVWVEGAKKYIQAYIKKIDELIPGKVYGIALLAGGTTEWYTMQFGKVIEEPSKNHICSFGKTIPSRADLGKSDEGILRCYAEDGSVLEYFEWYCSIVPKMIREFAETVKICSNKLVAVFYGYVVSDIGGVPGHDYGLICQHYAMPQLIFDCPDVDIILGPASYDLRTLDSTSAARVPIDSLSLSGKLYVHEIDSVTYYSYHNNRELLLGAKDEKFQSMEESIAYLRREIGMVLAKGHGFWIFDMQGGWYQCPELMTEMNHIRKLCDELMKRDCRNLSEIGFFIDTESIFYINMDADYPMFQYQVEELNKLGLPWDCYLTTDLFKENFDVDRIKLYIFPNSFKHNERLREKILELRKMGKCILFTHAAGYVENGAFCTEQMNGYTNFAMKKCDFEHGLTEIMVEGAKTKEFDFSKKINKARKKPQLQRQKFNMPPLFEIDEECEAWGRYKANGGIAFGIKNRESGWDAYCGIAPIPCDLLRLLCERAGIFPYCSEGTVIYRNSGFICLYSYEGGDVVLRDKESVNFTEFFTGEKCSLNECGAIVHMEPKQTKMFLKD